MPAVLNVGGGSKNIPLPRWYAGWRHVLLDIDPRFGAEVVMDARELDTLPPEQCTYDGVYCSNNREPYPHHDARRVARGLLHVLAPDGFAEVRVPDLAM